MTTSILHGLWQTGIPELVENGQSVTYSAPTGCILTRKVEGSDEWQTVTEPSPVVHSGARAVYQVVGTTEAQSIVSMEIA